MFYKALRSELDRLEIDVSRYGRCFALLKWKNDWDEPVAVLTPCGEQLEVSDNFKYL